MQLSQSRSTGEAELGQVCGSRFMFNLMRFASVLLSQHGLCLVTEAANIISEMCGQGIQVIC